MRRNLKRLSNKAGVELLRRLGVTGGQRDFETLVEDVKGHALTLNLLGTYLRDAYAGDIRRRDLVKLEEADAKNRAATLSASWMPMCDGSRARGRMESAPSPCCG